jgi:hypothetical protein
MPRYAQLEFEDIRTYAGQDLVWKFKVVDNDGEVIDITGWHFELWAQEQGNDSNLLIVEADDFTITSAASGLVECTMARAVTVNEGGKIFTVTLWRVDSGCNDDLAEGNWEILETVRPIS